MTKKINVRIVLPLALVVLAIVIAIIIVKVGRTKAEKNEDLVLPLVKTMSIVPVTAAAHFEATGTVNAEQQVTVLSEVGGTVVWISPRLTPGGVVKSGELLVTIDPREYKLKVDALGAQVKAAEIELARENARSKLAKEEWALSGEKGEASPLATRELQLESAKLNVEAAKSALDQAKIKLEKSEIRAPFDANVASKNVALGQVVGAQTQLMRLIGAGDLILEINVPIEALAKIELKSAKSKGSQVEICQKLTGDECIEAKGYVRHIVGELDGQTRQARLNITIPFAERYKGEIPLLPGAFVSATIKGKKEENIFTIPRKNVHQQNRIWTLLSDSTLQEREVAVRWADTESIYGVLDIPTVRLVTTKLTAPVNGLKVDPAE